MNLNEDVAGAVEEAGQDADEQVHTGESEETTPAPRKKAKKPAKKAAKAKAKAAPKKAEKKPAKAKKADKPKRVKVVKPPYKSCIGRLNKAGKYEFEKAEYATVDELTEAIVAALTNESHESGLREVMISLRALPQEVA